MGTFICSSLCKTHILNINTHLLVIFMQKKDGGCINKKLILSNLHHREEAMKLSYCVVLSYCAVEKKIFGSKNSWKKLYTDWFYVLTILLILFLQFGIVMAWKSTFLGGKEFLSYGIHSVVLG